MKDGNRALLGASLFIVLMFVAGCGTASSSTGSNTGSSGSNPSGSTFTIGGTVTGLSGTGLVLQDNGGDNLQVSGTGTISFTFATALAGGNAYDVTVSTQPSSPTQVCTATNNTGTVGSANVTNVQVTCQTPNISVGGTVTGLIGTGMVLDLNGSGSLSITANGTFTFQTDVLAHSLYDVTIQTQPSGPAQNCTISNGSGTTGTANVTNVQVNCPVPTFTVGGTVVGLLGNGGGMELQDNGGDNLTVTGNGSFTFDTPISYGGAYNITIFTEPSTQTQICAVFNASGTASAAVTNVTVDCGHNDWTWITGSNSVDATGSATPPSSGSQDTETPGARYNQATWTDSSGNLWMFSGYGYSYDAEIKIQPLYLDEMWEYTGTPVYNCLASGCLPVPGTGWTLVQPSPANAGPGTSPIGPDARTGATTWTDSSGKLWLFGGQDGEGGNVPLGLLNDLWSFDPSNTTWTLVSGSTTVDAAGSYGTKGSASSTNVPGARWGAVSWVDASGNFWIFGGQGYDFTSTNGLLNDLWEFNPTTSEWTWVAGSDLANQDGDYGIMGTASASNAPGGRQSAASWTDKSGNFWLFGGFGLDATGTPNGTLNDLWEFNMSSKQWVWVGPSGSNAANQHGVYGTQGTAAAANFPGSRWRAAAWTDHNGNLWLYGGFGLDSTGTGYLNDLWEYTLVTTSAYPAANQWTWVKGANTDSNAGVYGTSSVPFYVDNPGSRWGAGYWITFDPNNTNMLWIFGGEGYDSTSSGYGLLNDLWRYLPYP
jgi:hypothetical protein